MKRFISVLMVMFLLIALLCPVSAAKKEEVKDKVYLEPLSTYVCDFEDNYISGGLIADKNNPDLRCTRGEILSLGGSKCLNFYVDNNKEDFRFEIYNSQSGSLAIKSDATYTVTLKYKVTNVVKSEVTKEKTVLQLIRYDGSSEGTVINTLPDTAFSGGDTTDWQTVGMYFKPDLSENSNDTILAIKVISPTCPAETSENENLVTSILFDDIVVKEYEPDARAITFDTCGATGLEPLVAKTGTEISLPTPTRDNYTFCGWYSNEEYSNENNPQTMPNGSIKLFAKWEPVADAVVVTLNYNDGRPVTTLAGKVGDKLVLPKAERSGFYFVGWYDASGNRWEQTTVFPQNSVKLTARYENQIIVCNFEDKDLYNSLGSGILSGRFRPENIRANFGTYSLEYATEKGWNPENYKAQAGGGLVDSKGNRVRLENGKTYKVSFYMNVVDVVKSYSRHGKEIAGNISFMTAAEGGSWTNRRVYSSHIYTEDDISNNWSLVTTEFKTNFSDDSANYLYIAISGYSVLYIDDLKIWQVDENVTEKTEDYNLFFYTDGGTWIDTVYGKVNDEITMPEDPVRDGYVFTGWYSDINLETPFTQTKFADDNLVAYAGWEKLPEIKVEKDDNNKISDLIGNISGETPVYTYLIILGVALVIIAVVIVVIISVKRKKKVE